MLLSGKLVVSCKVGYSPYVEILTTTRSPSSSLLYPGS